MSIWGKILGGGVGLALGGPLGAIIGALGGHVIDSLKAENPDQKDGTKTIAFTIAVIVLGAKMAKADGRVTRDEINAFKQVLRIPPEEMKNVSRLFDQAKKDSRGFEPYAKQMAEMFAQNPEVLEELLWCLAHIARADGHLHPGELEFLYKVSEIFGFEGDAFKRVTGLCLQGQKADPYALLGIGRDADETAIKAAHRKLVMEHHPDRLTAQGMPEEFVELANEKLAEVNAAYDSIKAERGLR